MSKENPGKVISIQLLPNKSLEENLVDTQSEGADKYTVGYSIYLRHENGETKWVEDFETEARAIPLIKELCKEYKVPLEPFPWQIGLVNINRPDMYVDDQAAFESFASKQPFIKDLQKYDGTHPHWPHQYGHSDTQHARVMWDGGVAWTLAAMGYLGQPRIYLNRGDIRVVIEGRPGVGKSALAGLIHETMQYLGLTSTWSDEQHEKELQDQPWRDTLKEFAPVVRIEERVITPGKAYDMLTAAKAAVEDAFASKTPMELPSRRDYIAAAVDLWISEDIFLISKDDPAREQKIAELKEKLIIHLLNGPRPAHASANKSDIYPGPDGEQQ